MDDLTEQASPHYIHSTLRERIVEYVFVGEVLKRLSLSGDHTGAGLLFGPTGRANNPKHTTRSNQADPLLSDFL